MLTIQAMECLSHLSNKQKIIFLEALLDTIQIEDDAGVVKVLMQEAMKALDHPISDLDNKSYITQTETFADAFAFVKQKDRINAVPAVEINDVLFRKEVPDLNFIQMAIQENSHEK
jgi:hypothetical protein